jgi:hypothetical protein
MTGKVIVFHQLNIPQGMDSLATANYLVGSIVVDVFDEIG